LENVINDPAHCHFGIDIMNVGSTHYGIRMVVRTEEWPLREPFRITNHTWEHLEVLHVAVSQDGRTGYGEGAGIYYRNESPESMRAQLLAIKSHIDRGISRPTLLRLLPAGGARNALDCALWDLEARLSGQPAWQCAGIAQPRPLVSTYTCSANDPERMAEVARSFGGARAIKIKLTGESVDADRVRAVRQARPDVWLAVDGNQGFTPRTLQELMAVLIECEVQLIEQPFPAGRDKWLDGFDSPIAVAADESVQGLADLANMAGRYDVINIKLDKCGGLTEGLAMARAGREQGFRIMVGNMLGTSLAMAPAYLLGQLCDIVDLDGPVFLEKDREPCASYRDGMISCPEAIWGAPS
jgi:L-alanine-DL-glutamate epimerase-like enolase superfamily enzyme